MKKIILLLITLTQFSTITYSQDSLLFKSKYLPEKKYNQTIEQTSNSEIKYLGSDEFLEKLKNKGIQNPKITNKESFINCMIKTGVINGKSRFPLTIKFIKITSSDGEQAVPEGTMLYGNVIGDNMPTFDSITLAGFDEELKNNVIQSLQSIYSQLNFPEKKLKVGDEFTRESNLLIPIADVTIKMVTTSSYKLKSIIDSIASFDISQIYTAESTMTKYVITGKGTGVGQFLFDIKNNFQLKYEIDNIIEMNAKLGNFDLNIYTKSNYIQKTSISKN